jgi:hypothetical protein
MPFRMKIQLIHSVFPAFPVFAKHNTTMAEATRLMSICGISEEEAQYYLQIGDRELATAYRLFLLAKSDSPLTLESTAAICGFSPFELMVNPNNTAVTSSQIPTRDLTHWKQVPFHSRLTNA